MSTAPSPNLATHSALPFVKGPERRHAPAAIERLDRRGECFEALDVAPTNHASRRGAGELASPAPLPRGERESARGTPRPGAKGALGTTAKSRDKVAERAALIRRRSYTLQAFAREALPNERVAHCLRTPVASAVAIRVGNQGARYHGLQTCGCRWLCPFCSWRISNQRRDELNRALAWARAAGLVPVLLTLTARHSIHDVLRNVVDAMKRAKTRLHQSRDWRAMSDDLAGYVCASELTYGRNGWHFHFHQLMFVRAADEAEAIRTVKSCRVAWAAALRKEGLNCNGHGFDVQGAAHAGDYVTKWGAAEELALSGAKEGRSGAGEKGRTVWELMAAAADGDSSARDLWVEFARTFKGRHQLVWSKGLKGAAGIADRTDEEIVGADAEADGPEAEVGRMDRLQWQAIVRCGLRAELLEAVEASGVEGFVRVLALAQNRPPQRWRRGL